MGERFAKETFKDEKKHILLILLYELIKRPQSPNLHRPTVGMAPPGKEEMPLHI